MLDENVRDGRRRTVRQTYLESLGRVLYSRFVNRLSTFGSRSLLARLHEFVDTGLDQDCEGSDLSLTVSEFLLQSWHG